MHWRSVFTRLFGKRGASNWEQYKDDLAAINRIREELRQKPDSDVKQRRHGSRNETFAAVAEAIRRTLGLDPFDVQVIGGLALAEGKIAEMQTGEGKTLVATMPVAWGALTGEGVHVLTANDYLAERDAAWMGEVYRFLGLTVGFVAQGMPLEDRQRAYDCDVTYASATEIGFDFLRDQLRRHPEEIAQRPFYFALVDEVDSILIDEARIPLVIAGGGGATAELVEEADRVVGRLEAWTHYETVDGNRRAILTDAGALRTESLLGCGNLY
ncbi:MAG: preprotein translocase subunit SecA, partial [bacterium]|nr:preprotein translocase subunit SecA [bacterium]